MKFMTLIGGCLLACFLGTGLTAATVTVDKPSPPACCADGVCYPKTNTWGYYQRKWRQWPGQELEPTAAQPLTKPVPDIPRYETPTPQEEDRRAPPPTKPERNAPTVTPPAVMPTPSTEGTTPPGAGRPGGMLRGGPPAGETQEQGERETPRMPWDQPTGEWDPPPALPFGTADSDTQPAVRTATRPSGPQLRMPNELSRSSSAVDAPPALPLALGRTLK